jgi:hypothetical protein
MSSPLRITTRPTIAEMRRDLREVDPNLAKGLQRIHKGLAVDVAESARSEYDTMFTSHSGDHKRAIRALATQTKAQVMLDGVKAGGMIGQEFGAGAADTGSSEYVAVGNGRYRKAVGGYVIQGRNKRESGSSMRQFFRYVSSDSGMGGRGYFVYPTVRRESARIQDDYARLLSETFGHIFEAA